MPLLTFVFSFIKKRKIITFVFILGLFLRLLGTYPGYPLTHPDEPSIATSSFRMAFEANFKPQAYYYGQFLPLLYAVTYIIFYIPITAITLLPSKFHIIINNGIVEYIYQIYLFLTKAVPLHKIDFWNMLYWARYNSAVVSSLTIIAAYLVGKRLFSKNIALIGAFLVAINYRHVLSSRLVLADAPAAFFALLTVYFCTNLLSKTSIRNYILTGISIALSLSVKYFIYILPAFAICHFFGMLNQKTKSFLARIISIILNYKVVLAIIICIVIFIAINPYFLLAREEASYQWAANSARYGLKLSPSVLQSFNLSYYSLYYLFYYGLGPVITILTFLGFILGWIKYTKGTFIITSVAASYIWVFLIISGTGMVRNYSAILPFLLFFPALLIIDISQWISKILSKLNETSKFDFKSIIIFLLVTLAAYQPLNYDLISGYHFSRDQNMIALYEWMDNNLPDGSRIIGPSGIFYPAGRNFEAVRLIINDNQMLSMEEIKKQNADWAILNSVPGDISESLMLTKSVTQKAFFDRPFLEYLSRNTYNSLLFYELSDYRIAEFAKPLTQDPPFMVIKIPTNWNIHKDELIKHFDFKTKEKLKLWNPTFYPSNPYSYSWEKYKSTGSLSVKQTTPQCQAFFVNLESNHFAVEPLRWYTLTALGKRIANPIYKRARSGYFRLNFYDSNHKLIKTYVTHPLVDSKDWQELTAAGAAPKNSAYAKVSFQIDPCFESETYDINEINIYAAEKKISINSGDYPKYLQNFPLKEFEWIPQL